METNPFYILTFIAAPAILTNASSIGALSTSNRLARSTERVRAISSQLESLPVPDSTHAHYLQLLGHTEVRALFLVRALTSYYVSIGSFALASLASLLGAIFVVAKLPGVGGIAMGVSLCAGISGVGGLVHGCSLLVRETRITLRSLATETNFLLTHHQRAAVDRGAAEVKAPPK